MDRRESGNLGLALNPKRWKFGWLACHTAEWGEKERCWPQLLGQPLPRLHPLIINTYHMPPPSHPSGVLVAPSMHEIDSVSAMATP